LDECAKNRIFVPQIEINDKIRKHEKDHFLHGFFASGSCLPALTLKEALQGKAEVLTPDLPMDPTEAWAFIHDLCDRERPDLLVGNSCGSFYAQMLAPIVGVYYIDKVWGLFGEQDTLAHYEPLFLQHYNVTHHFPGGHTPTPEEVKTWYIPLIEKMLMTYERPDARYFRHFKGGLYRFVHTAFDSETQERMVVYQSLYGEKAYWVRPEKMFFEKVTRDGRIFNRFLETEI
jgi:hypothetical protein